MTKTEFLEKLRLALSGNVSYTVVNENIQYYDDYISMQMKKGEPEEAVIERLGDPRLLAKTIIDAGEYAEEKSEYKADMEPEGERSIRRIPGWLLLIIMLLVIVLIISFVGSVVSFLLPVIFPVIILIMFYRMFTRR